MAADVQTYEICQALKHINKVLAAGDRRPYAGRPWQVVVVYLVPLTQRGNRWILVMTDHFTSWCETIALPDATSPMVDKIIDERVSCYLGLPERIHKEHGAQFHIDGGIEPAV